MNFANVASITIPEGEVAAIVLGGRTLWQSQTQKYKREVAYLESSGTQYVDTGYIPSTDSKMELVFYPTVKQSTCYAGSRRSTSSQAFTINSGRNGQDQYGAFGNSGNVDLGSHSVGWHTVSIENGRFVYDGVETTISERSLNSTNAVYLFACNSSGASLHSKSRISACKIWSNSVLAHDIIPVLDWSDVPCMYDKVTDALLYNMGTGDFQYGEQEV